MDGQTQETGELALVYGYNMDVLDSCRRTYYPGLPGEDGSTTRDVPFHRD